MSQPGVSPQGATPGNSVPPGKWIQDMGILVSYSQLPKTEKNVIVVCTIADFLLCWGYDKADTAFAGSCCIGTKAIVSLGGLNETAAK